MRKEKCLEEELTTNSIKRIKLRRVRCASRLVGFFFKEEERRSTKSASRFEGELKTFEGEESVP